MNIDDKINNIGEALKNSSSGFDKNIIDAILDVLLDINDEIDELNEVILV